MPTPSSVTPSQNSNSQPTEPPATPAQLLPQSQQSTQLGVSGGSSRPLHRSVSNLSQASVPPSASPSIFSPLLDDTGEKDPVASTAAGNKRGLPPPDFMSRETYDGIPDGKHSFFCGSTQFRNWRYSPETLVSMRSEVNRQAIESLKQAGAGQAAQDGTSEEGGETTQYLTYSDELALVRLYVNKIPQLCGHFRFNEDVEATAMTYLKRFYLKNTVMDWHPKNVMLTALFLAAKTTNCPIALDSFTSSIPKTTPHDVLELEFLLAQSLNFEFTVWQPHKALWGMWLDLQSVSSMRPESIKDIYNAASDHVRQSRMTDAEFLYVPAQLAAAAFYLADPEISLIYMKAKATSSEGIEIVKEVARFIADEGAEPDVEVVREIDRRMRVLRGARDEWRKKHEEAERRQKEERRNAKALANRSTDDPFGAGESQKSQEGRRAHDRNPFADGDDGALFEHGGEEETMVSDSDEE